MRLNTIRKKMLFYFLMTTIIISSTSIYTFFISKKFINQMNYMFVNSVLLQQLENNLNLVDTNLIGFLVTKNSDNLNNYIRYSEQLKQKAGSIISKSSYQYDRLILEDVSNMINSYLIQTDEAVSAKRGRDINKYTEKYARASTIAGYIRSYIDKLNIDQIQKNTNYYLVLSDKIKVLQISNIVMIVDIILIAVFIIFYITYKMTEPIVKLSHSAEEISKGNFKVKEVIVSSDDEIKVMVEAFNKMKDSIQKYIEQLHNKAEMEANLMEAKMKNLKMQNLLDNAELQALQSQINPHFLFNTLNAGVQLSMIEGAEQTSVFLENVAALFRYNIQKLNKQVTLRDEVNNVKAYHQLLKVRFGDMIKFETSIDESLLNLHMPPLIIQPLVENAYIHGIGDSETGGTIKLNIFKQNGYVKIIVEDNGKGIPQERINEIMDKAKYHDVEIYKPKKGGHTTGIGLNNVIHRLNIFYGGDKVFNIESKEGKGTKMIISIFIDQKER